MLDILAPEFFEKGADVIASACHDIYMWPTPTPGQALNLPFLGSVLQVMTTTVFLSYYPVCRVFLRLYGYFSARLRYQL